MTSDSAREAGSFLVGFLLGVLLTLASATLINVSWSMAIAGATASAGGIYYIWTFIWSNPGANTTRRQVNLRSGLMGFAIGSMAPLAIAFFVLVFMLIHHVGA